MESPCRPESALLHVWSFTQCVIAQMGMKKGASTLLFPTQKAIPNVTTDLIFYQQHASDSWNKQRKSLGIVLLRKSEGERAAGFIAGFTANLRLAYAGQTGSACDNRRLTLRVHLFFCLSTFIFAFSFLKLPTGMPMQLAARLAVWPPV